MFVTKTIKECDEMRNLDMTALRSLAAVAETGGVTRAAHQLKLTQSAVSMQLKRLEESMGLDLIDRAGRKIGLTAQGELLLSYARRLLALNDEAWSRLTAQDYEGEITFGVPHDVVYPHIPSVLKQFAAEYPKVKLQLISSYTSSLKRSFEAGDADVIMTTEPEGQPSNRTLAKKRLVWVGAEDGRAWKQRPLRLASHRHCAFRPMAQAALDRENIPWEMAVDTDSSMAVDASLSADLAIEARLEDFITGFLEEIEHGGDLPDLPQFDVNLYARPEGHSVIAAHLAEMVREAYAE
jgi:DNA-binding transcriptional LysR family regulator